MIKQYFQQAWAQLRQQPLISGVTVAGTALSIFLIMLVVMLQQVQVEPFAPESNRDRFLHVKWGSITNETWGDSNSNGPWSAASLKEIYGKLTTPEAVTVYVVYSLPKPVSLPGQPTTAVDVRETDSQFWTVFDFAFTDGKPFDQATFDAGRPVAVITESVARLLFGTTKAVGKEFLLAHAPYRVCGVVKDVSTLAETAYAQVWIPYTSTDQVNNTWENDLMGQMSCTILARDRSDFPAIREECERLRQKYNDAQEGVEVFYRGQPDTQFTHLYRTWSQEPDVQGVVLRYIVVMLILLIVPAINLSSMTLSRMRRRMAEIGVRKAVGATANELMRQGFLENLLLTCLAGLLGLALSYAATFVLNGFLFGNSTNAYFAGETSLTAGALLSPWIFLAAFLFCLLMNLLSAGIPAWRASRMNIVEAINGKR